MRSFNIRVFFFNLVLLVSACNLKAQGTSEIIDIKIKHIQPCRYEQTLLLAKICIQNKSDDTCFISQESIDGFYCSVFFNEKDTSTYSKLIVSNIPAHKIKKKVSDMSQRNPAIMLTPFAYKLNECYIKFPAPNKKNPMIYNDGMYYVVNPKDSVQLNILLLTESKEWDRITNLTAKERKDVKMQLGISTDYYTDKNNVLTRAFTLFPPSEYMRMIFLNFIK